MHGYSDLLAAGSKTMQQVENMQAMPLGPDKRVKGGRGLAASFAAYKPAKPCDGTKCTIRKDLKECGGCHKVSYCSAKCQTEHWKSGHKKTCERAHKADAKAEAKAVN